MLEVVLALSSVCLKVFHKESNRLLLGREAAVSEASVAAEAEPINSSVVEAMTTGD